MPNVLFNSLLRNSKANDLLAICENILAVFSDAATIEFNPTPNATADSFSASTAGFAARADDFSSTLRAPAAAVVVKLLTIFVILSSKSCAVISSFV